MTDMPNVEIVWARCRFNRQSFGMRFEEQGRGQWLADWAFPIKERAAQREQYSPAQITGAIGFDPRYPGCPYCHVVGLFRCSCGGVACWSEGERVVTCPWCGTSGEITDTLESLTAGGDR